MSKKHATTDVAQIRRECELEDVRFYGLRRIKMNEWPETNNKPFLCVAGSEIALTVATRSRLPVRKLEFKITAAGLNFVVYPIDSVIFPEEATLIPDVVADPRAVDFAGNTTFSFLLKATIPADFPVGQHNLVITACSQTHLTLQRETIIEVLPAMTEFNWETHIVFWPHWHALCQYYGLAMWSEEFWMMADKYLSESAVGGANGIMLGIKDDPFRYPLPKNYYHHHEKICPIRWIKNKKGWSFDYSRYDRYVELNMKHGIDREIECHSLLPCKCQTPALNYYDSNGNYIEKETTFDAAEYEEAWGAFLTDFIKHNQERGGINC